MIGSGESSEQESSNQETKESVWGGRNGFGGLFILVVTTFSCLLVGGFITDLPYVSMTIIALHRYPVQLLLKE